MDWKPLSLAITAVLLILASQSTILAVGTPAGTTISVTCTMTSPYGSTGLIARASAATTVAQTASIAVQAGPVAQAVSPGQTYYAALTVVNSGNGIDAISLSASSAQAWATRFVRDDNGDGIHQSGETSVITGTGSLLPNTSAKCFLCVDVPATATSGDTLTVTGTSVYAPTVAAKAGIALPAPVAPAAAVPGDFNGDGVVSSADIDLFNREWLRWHRYPQPIFDPAVDRPYDLAPRTTGAWPGWTASGDGIIDIQDATAFVECCMRSQNTTISYTQIPTTYRTASLLLVSVPAAPYRIYQTSVALLSYYTFQPTIDSNGNLSHVLRCYGTGGLLYSEYDPVTRTIRLTGNVIGSPPYRIAAIYLGY